MSITIIYLLDFIFWTMKNHQVLNKIISRDYKILWYLFFYFLLFIFIGSLKIKSMAKKKFV